MIFIHQGSFVVSVIGIYLRSLFSMGTTQAGLLMLQNVIDDQYKSFAVSIYYLVINVDYMAASFTGGKLKNVLGLNEMHPMVYGRALSMLCIIPVVLAVPVFYMAGIYSKR